jgi:WD40 repeat protein
MKKIIYTAVLNKVSSMTQLTIIAAFCALVCACSGAQKRIVRKAVRGTVSDMHVLSKIQVNKQELRRLSFSGDSKKLVAIGGRAHVVQPDLTVKGYDPNSGSQIIDITLEAGHRRSKSAAEDNQVRTYSELNALAVSPDGRFVAVGTSGYEVKIFDADSGLQTVRLATPNTLPQQLEFASNKLLFIKLENGERWTVDAESGQVTAKAYYDKVTVGADVKIIDAIVLKDGRILASTGNKVGFYGGVKDIHLKHSRGFAHSVAFQPNRKLMAAGFESPKVGREGGHVVVWNFSAKRLVEFHGLAAVTAVEFSPDGRYLACATAMGQLVIFDVNRLEASESVQHPYRKWDLSGIR